MEEMKEVVDKILSNEITAFIFVLGAALGAFVGIAGGFYFIYKAAIYIGAY